MVFGLLYDPLPDAEFVLGRFREIKKNLHPTFKKKRYLVEGDMEKYLKSKNIIWKNTIKKKEKITGKNEHKFSWQYKKDEQFNFHIMPLFGVAFRCYSFDIPGFEAVMQFRSEDNYLELTTREYQSASALGSEQSSTKATRLARYLVKNYKFKNVSNMHF
tara:strand:- start:367 stop:846 length:480 start_codon:yes stop_codon:yes gene_type:complete